MPISLTTPIKHPATGESLPFAAARRIQLDPLGDPPTAGWIMHFGDIVDGKFVSKLEDPGGRVSVRDTPEELGVGWNPTGTDPVTGEPTGAYEEGVVRPGDQSFTTLVQMAIHVIEAGQVGEIITAYDLIGERAIYPYMQTIDPRFAGTIL